MLIPHRIPTVWIRRKSDGQKRKVNAIDYASDLGTAKYAGWELVSEQHGDKPKETVSGKAVGIKAQVGKEEMEAVEQIAAKETEGYKRRRNRPRRQPQVEVVDKEE